MKLFYVSILYLSVSSAFAQTVISGKVITRKGETVPLANVFLKDTYDGASSDENGNFRLETSEQGPHVLIVTSVGYKEFQRSVLLDGKPLNIEVKLEEVINELNAVTISAGSFAASDESRRTVFRALDIATTAGATADIAGALNTLPGTQKVGESGRLFVRGGDSNEARTFIDGMVVLNAYNPSAPNTPSRGRFLPFMFKGTSFSTGGYSAEYGQALSSALVLDSKDESEMSRTDIGVLSVGGDVAHTQAWKDGSAATKIQYTNLKPYMGLIRQRIDWIAAPTSMEGIGAFRQRTGKNGMVKVYGNFNHSTYSLYNHDIDDDSKRTPYDLANNYRYLNGFYKNALSDRWLLRGGLSYTFNQNDVTAGATGLNELEKGVHAKTVLEGSVSDRLELKCGVETIDRAYTYDVVPGQGTLLRKRFHETIAAAFTEADLYASNNFVSRIGGRFEYNNLTRQASLDPRISLAYKTGTSSQVSVAYGKFRQTANNLYVRENHTLDPEKAEHFILNYQHTADKRTFRVETYYKRYTDLVKFIDGNPVLLDNAGDGYARGVELFWRDNQSVKGLDYWISYSYLDTKRNYLNFPSSAMPTFASKHNMSVVGKYFFQEMKTQFGATFSVSSPRPYNNPNRDIFNGGRTPVYQDLSLNISYLPRPYIIVHFSCTNVLGRNNIFGYEYSTQPNELGLYNGRPVRQAAPRFAFIALFITLSKDKSTNQLPSL